jgi:hypothetical protein
MQYLHSLTVLQQRTIASRQQCHVLERVDVGIVCSNSMIHVRCSYSTVYSNCQELIIESSRSASGQAQQMEEV